MNWRLAAQCFFDPLHVGSGSLAENHFAVCRVNLPAAKCPMLFLNDRKAGFRH